MLTESLSRRSLLAGLGGLYLNAALPVPALAATPRVLNLRHIDTDETFRGEYHDGKDILPDALKDLTHLFRDYHVDQEGPIDCGVYDLLWGLSQRYRKGWIQPVTILIHSGYRTPETNAKLRKEGAATNSFHLEGKAVDLSVDGYGIQFLANHARRVATGGLGIYWHRHFVHLDTGPQRVWYRR